MQVAEDHVADKPTFAAPIGNGFRLPEGCCACGAPATRAVTMTLKTNKTARNLALSALFAAGGGIVPVTGGGSECSVEMPHCESCTGGADLVIESDTLKVRFRSYRYQQEFIRLQPGPAGD